MNKKILIVFLCLSIVALAALLYFYKFSGQTKTTNSTLQASREDYSHQMRGSIKETKSGSIIVEGVAMSSRGTNLEQSRTIEFVITPQTTLKNSAIVFTESQLNSGKPFKPNTEDLAGKISDLQPKVRIIKIQSSQDLFVNNKVVATDINYSTYVSP